MKTISISRTWLQLLDGEQVAIEPDKPQPGYWKRRIVKNGPWVACRIWIEEDRDEDGELIADEKIMCLLDEKPADPYQQWSWVCGHPVTKPEYDFMVDDAEWCRRHAPEDPKANPTKPINLRTMQPILPPGGKS